MEEIYVAEYHPKMGFHVESKSIKTERVLKAIESKDFSNEPFWMVFAEGTAHECNEACLNLEKELAFKFELENDPYENVETGLYKGNLTSAYEYETGR